MSTGLPPPLAAANATQPTNFSSPFNHFGYLFGQQPPAFSLQAPPPPPPPPSSANSRFKVKRHRQRVDAGEPRNTYQANSKSHKSAANATMMTMSIEVPWKRDGDDQQQHQHQNDDTECEDGAAVADETASCVPHVDVENTEELDEMSDEKEATSRESPSSTSSASKRKRFQPKKIGEQLGIDLSEEPEQINVSVGVENETNDEEDEAEEAEENEEERGNVDEKPQLTAIQQQLATNPPPPPPPSAAANLFETQKKLYAAFLEQQRKMLPLMSQHKDEKKLNCEQLVQTLKSEIFDNLTASIEKIVKDWASAELARQEAAGRHVNGVLHHQTGHFAPLFPPNPLAAAFPLHAPTHSIGGGGGGGIFPPNFNAFNHLQAFQALQRNLDENADAATPKKKRAKLSEARATSSPLSAPSSPPQARYFPPTMVGHPMYGNMSFGGHEREDSPTNSDEMSDFGGYDGVGVGGVGGSSSTLTPMHLRKAKLMFFYTRYPNSNLLKSYFPDIRFNKNNTAQLVKWFSNFREFYYIQMEKFARQLLAEGVKSRDEIFVTKDSELFKALNTHYNRNNHIQAPDRLVFVVQETLREFFDAIRLGKDIEPSWKKTIYKVINRMDDPIPDYFKDPNFLDRLET
ncbi:unnamed protein product [Caenorhabditis bovis]|uniref:Prospero domain-containing protein n=1 Tax=Caenorhabditis bovis TaxID=2654633 RepID=A0A8S1ER70_9PELO|nr:unnamed protein product [Caenorhabditis bovis]